jgi:hypothetical protein
MSVRGAQGTLAVLALALGLLVLVGCGSSSSSSSTSSSAAAATSATSASTASGSTAAAGATAASGSTAPAAPAGALPGAVATVAGTPITGAAVQHWLVVATDSSSTTGPKVVPVPPAYTACIAAGAKASPKSSAATLRSTCAQEYASLATQVVAFLISNQWVFAEAARDGLSVTAAQVQAEFTKQEQAQFQSPAAFAAFEKSSGQTMADLLERVRETLLSNEIRAKVTATTGNGITAAAIAQYYKAHRKSKAYQHKSLRASSAGIKTLLSTQAKNAVLTRFLAAFQTRWKAQTICSPSAVAGLVLTSYCGKG